MGSSFKNSFLTDFFVCIFLNISSSFKNAFKRFLIYLRGYIHVKHHIFQGLEWAHIWLFFKPGFRASKYTFSIVHKTNLETFGRKTPEIYHFEVGSLKKRVPRYLMTATTKSAQILSEDSLNHSCVHDKVGLIFKKDKNIFVFFHMKNLQFLIFVFL